MSDVTVQQDAEEEDPRDTLIKLRNRRELISFIILFVASSYCLINYYLLVGCTPHVAYITFIIPVAYSAAGSANLWMEQDVDKILISCYLAALAVPLAALSTELLVSYQMISGIEEISYFPLALSVLPLVYYIAFNVPGGLYLDIDLVTSISVMSYVGFDKRNFYAVVSSYIICLAYTYIKIRHHPPPIMFNLLLSIFGFTANFALRCFDDCNMGDEE